MPPPSLRWDFHPVDSWNRAAGADHYRFGLRSSVLLSAYSATSQPTLFWTLPKYPNYIIVYRPQGKPLQVVAILHGEQDLK